MGKNKKPKAHKKTQGFIPAGAPNLNLLNQKPLSADELAQRQKAVERLSNAFRALSAPPESLLALFERLALPYRIVEPDGEYVTETLIVINHQDFMAAEETNQKQGSIIQRLYPEDLPPSEPEPEPAAPLGDWDEEEFDLGKVQG